MANVSSLHCPEVDALWIASAEAMGFSVVRTDEAYASYDGRGTIFVGKLETLDADDSLAQLLFHEFCHALVEGPKSLKQIDWGLDNISDAHLDHERACLVLQTKLTDPLFPRSVFAPTTDHRAFYDALPNDPFEGLNSSIRSKVEAALTWSKQAPWHPHLENALLKTATVADIR